MIVSPSLVGAPRTRITQHVFTNHLLNNNARTEISWWNASDHSEPFPWKTNRTFFTGFFPGALPYYADLSVNVPINIIGTLSSSYHVSGGGPPASTGSLDIVAVDAAGADLFSFVTPPVGDRAANIYGIYVSQINVLHATVIRDIQVLTLIWQFADQFGNPVAGF